jgi:hypothetical protein
VLRPSRPTSHSPHLRNPHSQNHCCLLPPPACTIVASLRSSVLAQYELSLPAIPLLLLPPSLPPLLFLITSLFASIASSLSPHPPALLLLLSLDPYLSGAHRHEGLVGRQISTRGCRTTGPAQQHGSLCRLISVISSHFFGGRSSQLLRPCLPHLHALFPVGSYS